MTKVDKVRASRDGDHFHYHWAARHCLGLLQTRHDALVAVSIEGASPDETSGAGIDAGEEIIDVGLYYGAEDLKTASRIRYVQLKHSTCRETTPWTPSELEKTIAGFAKRYCCLIQDLGADNVAQRFRFELTTNRPVSAPIRAVFSDHTADTPTRQTFITYTSLPRDAALAFLALVRIDDDADGLWTNRNLLRQDLRAFLPGLDSEAPLQLKELVARKATSEFKSNPTIRKRDLLAALGADEGDMFPARSALDAAGSLARKQEAEVIAAIQAAPRPVILHAEGGVGKTTLAARLAAAPPPGIHAVIYDCFGAGDYRHALGARHRHKDAIPQITNELAAAGLCHPLIPTQKADASDYMRAFADRLIQAAAQLRAATPDAQLWVIIDAADNAVMATAEQQPQQPCFVRDLARMSPPDGVRLIFTCRSHRREMLNAPPPPQRIEVALRPFSLAESIQHLRRGFPDLDAATAAEIHSRTSANPRVQALAMQQAKTAPELLRRLGPEPVDSDQAIGLLLEGAVAKLKDDAGAEAPQIEALCHGLSLLRPVIPITVLATLAHVPDSAARSFALDLGFPLLESDSGLQFRDEPTETWFRERFNPDAATLNGFIARLKPVAKTSAYVAAALPALLLRAGGLDELVRLALKDEALPDAPLEKRDVAMQRLIFAVKACLQDPQRRLEATQLALKAAGECAGEQRHIKLIQENTDLTGRLLPRDRLEEIVARRSFSTPWRGGHYAYEAALLSAKPELHGEARSRLRLAHEWLWSWLDREDKDDRNERVTDKDLTDISYAVLQVSGPERAAQFVREWRPRTFSFQIGRLLADRLLDHGAYDQIDALAHAAGNNIYLLLALVVSSEALGHNLPARPLARLMRLLADRRVKVEGARNFWNDWVDLNAVRAAVTMATRVLPPDYPRWAQLLQRYLPEEPPECLNHESPFDYSFYGLYILQAYALEASLRGHALTMGDVTPVQLRPVVTPQKTPRNYAVSQTDFERNVGGLLPWVVLSAEILCGRPPADGAAAVAEALQQTRRRLDGSWPRSQPLWRIIALEWFGLLRQAGVGDGAALAAFKTWLAERDDRLATDVLTQLCRQAARAPGFECLAWDLAPLISDRIDAARDHADTSTAAYIALARAILPVSEDEAKAYLDRAVEIASRIGDEALDRWRTLLDLAKKSGVCDHKHAKTAYKLSRAAELTKEYFDLGKYCDHTITGDALAGLAPAASLAILSRWRDRRFGFANELLRGAIGRLVQAKQLPPLALIVLTGLDIEYSSDRLADLREFLAAESDPALRKLGAQIAYRYLSLTTQDAQTWRDLQILGKGKDLDFPELERLIALCPPKATEPHRAYQRKNELEWNQIFTSVDLSNGMALISLYKQNRPDGEELFKQIFARISPGGEAATLKAIIDAADHDIFILRYVLDALADFRSFTLRQTVKQTVLETCRKDPHHAAYHMGDPYLPFDRLYGQNIVTPEEVRTAVLAGFKEQAETLGAPSFLRLADTLTHDLTPNQAHQALDFGLKLLEGVLRPEDGDGPWRRELTPDISCLAAFAGYLWVGLGSPEAAERWRFAHVVRIAVELGWADLIAELVEWARKPSADPFTDARLPFYLWHARQWLAIGLARGALERPESLRPAVDLLTDWLRIDHVVIRAFAAQALRALVAAGVANAEGLGDLAAVNCSKHPDVVDQGFLDDEPSMTEINTDEMDRYLFGIYIPCYWFPSLGRVFNITTCAVDRRARQIAKQYFYYQDTAKFPNDPRREIYCNFNTHHAHGARPDVDSIHTYYGYHATMFVAADLLRERPARRYRDDATTQFEYWLEGELLTCPEGRWSFDYRDPVFLPEPTKRDDDEDLDWPWLITAEHLDRQLTNDDGRMVLWGSWSIGEEDISVLSAFAPREQAAALAWALQTEAELNIDVPFNKSDSLGAHNAPTPYRRWLTPERRGSEFEKSDPWGGKLDGPSPSPTPEMIERLGLTAAADGRRWTASPDVVLRHERWSQRTGYGRDETTKCDRFTASAGFLDRLRAAYPDETLLIGVRVWRPAPEHEYDQWPQPYIRLYLLEAAGPVYVGDHPAIRAP